MNTAEHLGEYEEDILKPDTRFTLFPIKNMDLWEMCEKALASIWLPTEVDLMNDLRAWEALSEPTRIFLEHILAFFACGDEIVIRYVKVNFLSKVHNKEIQYFYVVQEFMEVIHSQMYSLLIETFIKQKERKHELYQSIQTIPAIGKKILWMQRWFGDSFVKSVIALACIEGIFFSGAFCAIYYLKHRGVHLPGLFTANEFIAKDEGLHCDFACLVYTRYIKNKLNVYEVNSIIESAIEVEVNFIQESLRLPLIGMRELLMIQYVKYCADRVLKNLGYEPLYDVTNPFPWMTAISLDGKTNFFEKRVSEYSKPNIGVSERDKIFSVTSEF